MNAPKCRPLGACIAECTCAYQWRGKWPTRVVAMQCWKGSGSAAEQFQRKPKNITPLLCISCVVCRRNKHTTSENKQTDRQTQLLYCHMHTKGKYIHYIAKSYMYFCPQLSSNNRGGYTSGIKNMPVICQGVT